MYKIYLYDARVEEANEVLMSMRQLMQADGAAGVSICTFASLWLLSFSPSIHACVDGG
jgi:hypothetical protein